MKINFWQSKNLWKKSSINTAWCLFGCSLGDIGALFYFSRFVDNPNPLVVMVVAICCGLLTSIMLESFIMYRQLLNWADAIRTAFSMSFLSMIAMELSANTVDFMLVGPGNFEFWVLPFVLFAGFIVPLPYNYYKLKKTGKSCH